MATLDIYPPVALYVAGRFAHIPRKGHVEDFAIAMNIDEASLHRYAMDKCLYGPNNTIRSCDLQIQMTDDIDEHVKRLEEHVYEVQTHIERLAHAYKIGLPCNIFLG